MTDIYANIPVPPSSGDYPDKYEFASPGQSVEGVLREVRMSTSDKYDPCPIMDIQTTQVDAAGQPVCWSVFCGPKNLWRQLMSLKPPVGSLVRVTFLGFEGQAKLFNLEVAPQGEAPVAQAPVAAPAAAPAFASAPTQPPAPAFAQPAAQPQPAAPAATPAPPWGS